MELFQAKDHYILQSGDNALWCSRKDGSLIVRPGNGYISTYMCQGPFIKIDAAPRIELKSPDLNMIESVWDYIKRQKQLRQPK